MVQYSLSHLSQPNHQQVSGPIQDDEALLLFAIIKTCNIKTVLEIGGMGGYSATNFLEAVGPKGKVYTVDMHPVKQINDRHIVITKNIAEVMPVEFDNSHIDMLFCDAHVYQEQMTFIDRINNTELLNQNAIIALHDTNTHPVQTVPWAYRTQDGWVHQQTERRMVNELVKKYDFHCIHFHTPMSSHDNDLPYRHGLSILKKYKPLLL